MLDLFKHELSRPIHIIIKQLFASSSPTKLAAFHPSSGKGHNNPSFDGVPAITIPKKDILDEGSAPDEFHYYLRW